MPEHEGKIFDTLELSDLEQKLVSRAFKAGKRGEAYGPAAEASSYIGVSIFTNTNHIYAAANVGDAEYAEISALNQAIAHEKHGFKVNRIAYVAKGELPTPSKFLAGFKAYRGTHGITVLLYSQNEKKAKRMSLEQYFSESSSDIKASE